MLPGSRPVRRFEQRQFELQAVAAGGTAIHVQTGQAARGSSQRRGRHTVARTFGQRSEEQFAQASHDLVGEGHQVTTVPLELIEQTDAIQRIATGKRGNETIDARHLGQAKQVTDGVGVNLVQPARDDLIEHRLRIAHAACRTLGDELDRVVADRPALGLGNPPQLAADLLLGQWPEGVPLQARDDRRPDARGVGRAEDEEHVGRWLLERLQEHVPAFLDALHLVDDEDLLAQIG